MNVTRPGYSLTNWLRAAVPRRHIFLLSHMRGYSSLFGHILGSNPEICGYYEMHIGYYGWKSLIRQRLLYSRDERLKPRFTYMFDKVLHNDHEVAVSVLDSPRTRIVFALRPPAETVPSIVRLYRSVEPGHRLTTPDAACQYYMERLDVLRELATSMKGDYFYLDAGSLVARSEECLRALSQWLELREPLSPHYEIQKHTARKRFGDTSAALQSGAIKEAGRPSDAHGLDEPLLQQATERYHAVREVIAQRSGTSFLLESTGRGAP